MNRVLIPTTLESPTIIRTRRTRSCGVAVIVALATTTASLLSAVAGPAAANASQPTVPAIQQLAVLLSGHQPHTKPEATSPALADVAPVRPITGEQTALPVIGTATSADGVQWLQVMLPGRPNGSTGWIVEKGTRLAVTAWHLVVNLGARTIKVYRDGQLAKRFGAVVGKPSTPTPTGQFFVEETLHMNAGDPGGPFALALSARSNVLQEFEGGPGQIAIHGRDNLGGTIGAAESHGCMRLATASIDWLAKRIGPGVPVTIDS
jgi:lipoprotein-anchoring transpeptidase ErfK/SrfK